MCHFPAHHESLHKKSLLRQSQIRPSAEKKDKNRPSTTQLRKGPLALRSERLFAHSDASETKSLHLPCSACAGEGAARTNDTDVS